MHTKILGGGGGVYGNSGSCGALINYLQHEDREMIFDGKEPIPFFSLQSDNVSPEEVQQNIDNNRAKLCKDDAKFFSIVVSPSAEEINVLGKNDSERIENLKNFVRNEVMQKYAENFNKGLNNSDVMFYAKIHQDRGDKNSDGNLHCHIVISRKTMDNKIKISPQTNHKNTSNGIIKGGFNRKQFMENVEKSFDKKFSYERSFENTFEYKDAMKNGDFNKKMNVIEKNAKIKNTASVQKENRSTVEIKHEIKLTPQVKQNRGFKR